MHGGGLVGVDLHVAHLGEGGTERLLWGVSGGRGAGVLTAPRERVAARRPRARRAKDMAADGGGGGGEGGRGREGEGQE